jgi:hypothetical protein
VPRGLEVAIAGKPENARETSARELEPRRGVIDTVHRQLLFEHRLTNAIRHEPGRTLPDLVGARFDLDGDTCLQGDRVRLATRSAQDERSRVTALSCPFQRNYERRRIHEGRCGRPPQLIPSIFRAPRDGPDAMARFANPEVDF